MCGGVTGMRITPHLNTRHVCIFTAALQNNKTKQKNSAQNHSRKLKAASVSLFSVFLAKLIAQMKHGFVMKKA